MTDPFHKIYMKGVIWPMVHIKILISSALNTLRDQIHAFLHLPKDMINQMFCFSHSSHSGNYTGAWILFSKVKETFPQLCRPTSCSSFFSDHPLGFHSISHGQLLPPEAAATLGFVWGVDKCDRHSNCQGTQCDSNKYNDVAVHLFITSGHRDGLVLRAALWI